MDRARARSRPTLCEYCWYANLQVKQKQKELDEVRERLNKRTPYPKALMALNDKIINELETKQKQLLAFIAAQNMVIDKLKSRQMQHVARLLVVFLNDKDSSDS